MLTGLLIGRPGTTEVLIIALVIVLLFGASKIPKLARSMGEAKSEFEKGLDEGRSEAEDDEDEEDEQAAGS